MYKLKIEKFIIAVEKKLFNTTTVVGGSSVYKLFFENIQRAALLKDAQNKHKTLQSFSDILDKMLQAGAMRILQSKNTQEKTDIENDGKKKRVIERMIAQRKKFMGGVFTNFTDLVLHDSCEERFQIKMIIRQLVQNLRDFTTLSYEGLKQRRNYIVGKENGKAGELKKKLIKMLVDKDYFLMNQA